MPNDPYATLEKIAEQLGDLYPDYSGRFMYGARCVGIVTSNPMKVIEEASANGIRGALTDNMGKDTIVYWPHVKAPVQDAKPAPKP
jgi:hypothetical protein